MGPRVLPYGLSIQRLPTLTEVVEVGAADAATSAPAEAEAADGNGERVDAETAWPVSPADPLEAPLLPTEAELTARVLADVQRQVELMLEHRLREALMPALLQATDALVLQARTELASAMRDVVARAVAQELARRR